MSTQNSILVGALLVIAVAAGYFFFKNHSAPAAGNGLPVVASFYPMYFFASELGGDKVSVVNLTPPGTEPHDYEPPTRDLVRMESSKLVVLNGGIEAWGERIQAELEKKGVPVVVAGQGLFTHEETAYAEEKHTEVQHAKETHAEHGGKDPHVWLDPVLAKEQVKAIASALILADFANADFYASQRDQLLARLDALDASFKQGLAQCKTREIVTSHAAFSYLADRYGLTQEAIAGLSPEEEPSPAQLADIADFARAHGVTHIFFETLVSPRLSETIAREIGAQTLVLDTLEGISDADKASGKNYFTVMEENLKNLRIALQCS